MTERRIIDTHNHLWEIGGSHFDWINDEMSVIRRNFYANDLLEILSSNNVGGSILVQAVPELEETEWLLDIAEENEFVKGVIGWCDISKGSECGKDIQKLLERSKLLKGIRYMSQDLPPDHLIDRNFIEGVMEVGRQGLVYELLIKHNQLESAIELVKACPDTTFVVEHIAKPDIKNGNLEKWAQDIKKLADISDKVNCKISGMVTEADWKNWSKEDFEPYIRTVFEAFGEDRVVFGSDWPVLMVAASYDQVIGLVSDWLDENDSFDKDKFFYDNAMRIYNL